jgi:hypothetical protein
MPSYQLASDALRPSSPGTLAQARKRKNPVPFLVRGFANFDIVKEKSYVFGRPCSDLLSQALRLSTIGAEEFDGRVRDGIGSWAPRKNHKVSEKRMIVNSGFLFCIGPTTLPCKECWSGVSNRSFHNLCGHRLMRTIKPIELLVPVSFTHCCASTPGLSTWWSSTALKGILVLKEASCLDAFSSYPVRI